MISRIKLERPLADSVSKLSRAGFFDADVIIFEVLSLLVIKKMLQKLPAA